MRPEHQSFRRLAALAIATVALGCLIWMLWPGFRPTTTPEHPPVAAKQDQTHMLKVPSKNAAPTPRASDKPRVGSTDGWGQQHSEPFATDAPSSATQSGASQSEQDGPPEQTHSSEPLSPSTGYFELSAATVTQWRETVWRDCHGDIVIGCRKLINTFTKVLEAPDNADDGWSEWMEEQIRASLSAKASEYKFTRTDVKCASEGCVFILYSETSGKMFDTGYRYSNDFDKWLREQPWNEWLEVHEKQNGNRSTLAWRVVGFLKTQPFINWYIVTPRQ
jgi:hypothetical protein